MSTVDITVITPNGTSETSTADEFTFIPSPTFTGITPTTGGKAGGSPVLIEGTNFTGATTVTFGGTAAALFDILSDTQIAAITPAHAAGWVSVAITGPGGTATGSNAYLFDDDTSTVINTEIDHGMDDACAKATFRCDGIGVGLSDGDYLTKTVIQIPDATGTLYTKFVGVCIDSTGTFKLANEEMALTAYDYRLFLQKKPLDDSDLALLPVPYQSGENLGRVLTYKSLQGDAFIVGQQVWGVTSGAIGRIVEINLGTTTLTMYPARGTFVDSEELKVGDTLWAYADGASTTIPYSSQFGTTHFEDWVARLLGGSSWATKTGIYPYKIVATTHDTDEIFDTDPVTEEIIYAVPKYFTEGSNRWDALKDRALYLRRIVHCKPVQVSGIWYCGMWVVRISQIDDATYGLDLPDAATITEDDVEGDISLICNGDDQYERIHIWSKTLSGHPIDSFYPTTEPMGPYREYAKEYPDICTQEDLDDLCLDLYNAYSPRNQTWTVTLTARPDLEVYQKLILSGFSPKVPNGTYRIIRITPVLGLATNTVQIRFITNTAFTAQLRLGWTYQDSIAETYRMIDKYSTKIIGDRPITYLSANSDGSWNVTDDNGRVFVITDGGTSPS